MMILKSEKGFALTCSRHCQSIAIQLALHLEHQIQRGLVRVSLTCFHRKPVRESQPVDLAASQEGQ